MDTGALVARGVATANHFGWVAGAGAEIALSRLRLPYRTLLAKQGFVILHWFFFISSTGRPRVSIRHPDRAVYASESRAQVTTGRHEVGIAMAEPPDQHERAGRSRKSERGDKRDRQRRRRRILNNAAMAGWFRRIRKAPFAGDGSQDIFISLA
jgi:hypothetical protein